MKIYYTILILLILINESLYCQSLPSLYETANYLEEKLLLSETLSSKWTRKTVEINIEVTEYGVIKIIRVDSVRKSPSANLMNGTRIYETKFDSRDVYMEVDEKNPNLILIKCFKEECIDNNYSSGSIYTRSQIGMEIHSRYTDKIINALDHFLKLAKAKANLNAPPDIDPFSESNYNSLKRKLTRQEIPISRSIGGLHEINFRIGSLTLKGFIDSGASSLVISEKLLYELQAAGYASKENQLLFSQVANGDVIASKGNIIKSLVIGTAELNDIEVISFPSDIDILIGQSILSRFSSWSINNNSNKLILEP